MENLIQNLESFRFILSKFGQEDFDQILVLNKELINTTHENFKNFNEDYFKNRHRERLNQTDGAKYKYGYLNKFEKIQGDLGLLKSVANGDEGKLQFLRLQKEDWDTAISDVHLVITTASVYHCPYTNRT